MRSKYGNFSTELELGCEWVGEARVSNLDLLHVDFICYGMRVDDVGTNEFVSAELEQEEQAMSRWNYRDSYI